MVPFQIVTSWSQWSEVFCNSWWMTIAGDCLEVFSFSVMQSPFGFANVEILTVPATSFLHVYILGDPGAVSRVGRKGGTKVFITGERAPGYRLSPNYFQKFKRMPVSDWAQKNALYYCAQSANSFSWVLFVSSYTTAVVSPQLPGLFTKLVRARETFVFYFPNQKRRNYRWVAKTFGMLSAGAIQFVPRIFCFWRITTYRK